VSEPEVAIAFTADPWVEVLHRHLTDHGGARVRSLVVEPEGAVDESYDVLLAGHRWSALTRALVADVRARGRAVIGVCDPDEPAGRHYLHSLGVDALIDSDAGPEAFVRAITAVAGRRSHRDQPTTAASEPRSGRLVVVAGPPGTGRTEIAIELTVALRRRRSSAVLLDADDVGPAVAQRLQLPLEPNLRTAIDAVEHARGDLARCFASERVNGLRAICGLPNASAWSHVRPGEVVRVAERLTREAGVVIADTGGSIEDVQTIAGRGRYATARAMLAEADIVICVCDASPTGVARLLAWIVDARNIAPSAPYFVVLNRAPTTRFRRGELFEELTTTVPVQDVVFVPPDGRVGDAAWNGTPVARGPFTRAVTALADKVLQECRRSSRSDELEIAS
jgi:MinD-like ATPase involved in chromosome partitioning or flagellar assembly